MDLSESEINRLTHLCNIRNENKQVELECIFNQKNSIHFTEFANVFTHIKKKASLPTGSSYKKNTWQLLETSDTLDIQVHESNNINQSRAFNIRITLGNKNDISKFCRTDSLTDIDAKYMYKNSSNVYSGMSDQWHSSIKRDGMVIGDYVVLSNTEDGTIKGTIKDIIPINKIMTINTDIGRRFVGNKFKIESKKKKIYETINVDDIQLLQYGLYLENYDIKVNVKSEVDVAYISTGDDKTFFDDAAEKEHQKFEDFIARKGGMGDVFKTFRLKNRYSYRYNHNRLDITVVRSSKEELNSWGQMKQKPVQTFIESDLINQDKKYEVELEIDYNYKRRSGMYNTANTSLRVLRTLKEIKLLLNSYPVLISKREETLIGDIYKSLIRTNHTNIIKKKQRILLYERQQQKIKDLQEGETLPKEEKKLTINDISKSYVKKYLHAIKESETTTAKLLKGYDKMLEDIAEVHNMRGKKWNKYKKNNTYFIGPKLISMTLKDIQKDNPDSLIGKDYSITDKADGLGMILYVVGSDHLTDDDTKRILENDDIRENRALLETYKGSIYLIDQNFKIYKTDLEYKDSLKDTYANSVLNGEYLDSDKIGQSIHMYKIYDMYIFNGKDVKDLPLHTASSKKKSRLHYVNNFLSDSDTSDTLHMDIRKLLYKSNPITTLTDSILDISQKKFYYSWKKKSKQDLFTHSDTVWKTFMEDSSIYKYDGIIYTPINDPVCFNEKSVDYDLFTNTMWSKNIKWKPPYENTIDFLVKEVKKETFYNGNKITTPLIQTKRHLQDGNVMYDNYKTFHLQVGKNIYNDRNVCKYNTKRNKSRYLGCLFVPSILYDPEAYVANLKVNPQNKEIYAKHWNHTSGMWVDNSFDVIKDNTIVECAYSNFDIKDGRYTTDKAFRWVPIRTRHDKTFAYRKGMVEKKRIYNILHFLMSLDEGIYRNPGKNINQYTLRKYISEVKDILDDVPELNMYRVYQFNKGSRRDYNKILNTIIRNKQRISSYYSSPNYVSKNININYGNNFNTANNVWFSIHNPVTIEMITQGLNIPTLDMYELKYYNQDLNIKRSKSVSIQLQRFHNHIKNDMIQNCTHILRNDDKDKKLSLLDLATGKGGDLYKWINNKIDVVVGIDKVYDNIYNNFDGACIRHNNHREKNLSFMPSIDFIVADVSNILTDEDNFMDTFSKNLWFERYNDKKYNIVSMMFAIHYLFNSKQNIDTLVSNINNYINEDGYFIGCCFDGQKIFTMLQDINYNETKTGLKDGKIIWKIKKKYNLDSWVGADDDMFYNLPIEVYIQSINMTITEYLVNFDLLVKKLQEKNIRLEQTDTFDQLYTAQDKFQLSPDEQALSFLNRRFLFKKASESQINIDKVYTMTLQILGNIVSVNDYKKVTKKLKLDLKRELKKDEQPNWDAFKTRVRQYIFIDEEMEVSDFDTNWDQVYKKLKSDIKWYK